MSKRHTIPNARFWTWLNDGWVKITLKPEQTLEFYSGGQTDEGFSNSWESWEHEGDRVVYNITNDSRDCDGRHGTHYGYECGIGNMASREPNCMFPDEWNPPGLPEWTEVRSRNYDQSAEAAGY